MTLQVARSVPRLSMGWKEVAATWRAMSMSTSIGRSMSNRHCLLDAMNVERWRVRKSKGERWKGATAGYRPSS